LHSIGFEIEIFNTFAGAANGASPREILAQITAFFPQGGIHLFTSKILPCFTASDRLPDWDWDNDYEDSI